MPPARAARSKRSFGSRLFRGAIYALLGWVALSTGLVLALRWGDPPTSAFMLRERVLAWRDGDRGYTLRHEWTDWSQIAWQMKVAVIAAEDQKFPSHWGFDLASIRDALDERERGGRMRGASTVSQQVAKNLFLWPQPSWVRKGLEAYFTVLIEALWPKQRVLEVYLNIAELGDGVYGVGAASEIFFDKPPARLNTHEAALLAAVLPSPKRMHAGAPSRYVRSRQHWIVAQMSLLGGQSALTDLK